MAQATRNARVHGKAGRTFGPRAKLGRRGAGTRSEILPSSRSSASGSENVMARVTYRIIPHQGGWGVDHDGGIAGPYVNKEAALEAAVGPAMNAIKLGDEVRIMVPGSEGEPMLGSRDR
jgi:hypothetical protein